MSDKRLLTIDLGHDRYDRSVQPKHERLRDHLVKQIKTGRLRPGQVLPSDRRLMETLGVARTTVRQAMSSLENDGLIRRIQGKGTFVEDDVRRKLRRGLDIFALVVPEVGVGLYPSLTRGFIEAAAESHHQVMTCNTHSDMHVQGDVILQLVNKNVAGVAIVPTTINPMPAYQLDMLKSHGIPVVFCHRRPEGLVAPLITWPFEEVGRLAGEEIVGRGHRRAAFVATGPYVVSNSYLDGLREVLTQNGLELPEHRLLYNQHVIDPPAEDDVHRALAEMLEAPDRPTVVLCSDVTEAERVFLEAVRLGLRVPEDLSIIGFGCVWREGTLSQRLSAVTIDERDLGRRAALLIEQMRTGQQPLNNDEYISVPLEFSEGQTIGAASGEPQLVEGNCMSSYDAEGDGRR